MGSSRYGKSSSRAASDSAGESWKRTDLDGSALEREPFLKEDVLCVAGRSVARAKSDARDGLFGLLRVDDVGPLEFE